MTRGCSSSSRLEARSRAAGGLAALLWLVLALPATAEPGGEDDGLIFVGEATLGANLYDISPPFNSSAIGGFFDQWRYIENKEDSPPYYVDLMYLNLGVQRLDGTYLTQLELWSPNLLNERGTLDAQWRGLELEVNYRRQRNELLRFFPDGTNEGVGYGSEYFPDTPNDEILDANRRFWIKREGFDGTLSLDFDEMGWSNPAIEKLSLYGDYQVRKGYRQDSLLGPGQSFGDFQGARRRVDQEVASVGAGLLTFPFEVVTAKLDVNVQSFTERAPQDVEFGFFQPDFVPDTNRITARLDVSRRFSQANFTLGAFVTHLEQTGDETPLQKAVMLDKNVTTRYSVWGSFDSELPSIFELTGYAKWTYLDNGVDPDFSLIQVSSPYMRASGDLKANLEIAARPVSGTRAALGYRAEYTHRSLRYGGFFTVQPEASAIRPNSLHHYFYLSARSRLLRGLNLQGEIGFDWGPEVSYANEFEKAVYFEGRGDYTLPIALPVVLSASSHVKNGKSPGYEFAGFLNSRTKSYERLVWRYDVTATVVPMQRLSLFTTFAQVYDDQDFTHLRATNQRRFPGTEYFIDSNPDYRSNVKSLSTGGSLAVTKQVDFSAAASLTWTNADYRGPSTTDRVLEEANQIDTRIVTLESDLDYEVVEGLGLGIGYRWQQYQDNEVQEFLDYSGTIHTVTLRATVDLAALPKLFR